MTPPSGEAALPGVPSGGARPNLWLMKSEHELPDGRYLVAYGALWEGAPRPDLSGVEPSTEPPGAGPSGREGEDA
jgi:hypothetical protein